MSKFKNQAGYGAAEIILMLAVLGLVGFVGWRVYDQNKPVDNSPAQVSKSKPIEKAEDLDKEIETLNSQDIDEELDTSELDAVLE